MPRPIWCSRHQPRPQPRHRRALFRHGVSGDGGHDRGSAGPGREQRRFPMAPVRSGGAPGPGCGRTDLRPGLARGPAAQPQCAAPLSRGDGPPGAGAARPCAATSTNSTNASDPRGRTYYWLAGEVVDDIEASVAGHTDWPTDVAHVAGGGVSLSRCSPNCSGVATRRACPGCPGWGPRVSRGWGGRCAGAARG
jgi:hypothetical protein